MVPQRSSETLVFEQFDLDLLVKVLENTAFSPFFLFFIPVFYVFHGAKVFDRSIVVSSIYLVCVSIFWFVKWYSSLFRNQGNLLFASPRLDWSDQIVIITGGSSGIGELLANTLAVRSVTVVVLDIKPIKTENHNICYYKCDVSNWKEVEDVSKRVVEEIGEPTILINNAGVVQGKLLIDLSPEDIQQTFGVNTIAHFYVLKAFLPYLLKRKSGHIVTMASVLGMSGVAQMTDYCASKSAIISLHESLRYELDNWYHCPQIRTTLVCPGHTETLMFKTVTWPKFPLFKFFCPSLQPVAVVKRIIAALDIQHSQCIYLPFYVNFVPFIGHLPSFLRDLVQKVSGADYAMINFIKLSGRRPEEGDAPLRSSREARMF